MDEMNGKGECDGLNGIKMMKELTCTLVYVNLSTQFFWLSVKISLTFK